MPLRALIAPACSAFIALFIALFVALSVAGCGDPKSPPPAAPVAERAAAPADSGVRAVQPPSSAAVPTTPPASPSAPAAPDAPPSAPAGGSSGSSDSSASSASSTGPHDPAAGKELYLQNCSTCHGVGGAGDGPVGVALNPRPARHDDGHYMNALSNDHLFKVIQQGGVSVGKSALMAPWSGSFSEEQIWDLVAFVRTLAVPPYTGPKP
jgi:mono/diheme cytochrome c family protein